MIMRETVVVKCYQLHVSELHLRFSVSVIPGKLECNNKYENETCRVTCVG